MYTYILLYTHYIHSICMYLQPYVLCCLYFLLSLQLLFYTNLSINELICTHIYSFQFNREAYYAHSAVHCYKLF